MSKAHRPLSISLALLVFVTSVLNVLLVECVAGPDHHRIEAIGHQADLVGRDAPGEHPDAHGAELHPEACNDLPLADEAMLQRLVVADFDAGDLPPLITGSAGIVLPSAASPAPRRCPVPPPSMRPVIDEIDTVRLLT